MKVKLESEKSSFIMPQMIFRPSKWLLVATFICSLYILYVLKGHAPRIFPIKEEIKRPQGPIYKDLAAEKVRLPVEDNFPLADTIVSKADFPAIPSWNKPPSPHVPEKTPLLIGFTRNWPMLQRKLM